MASKDCYDVDTQEPVSRPIKCLQELEAWKPGLDPFCVGTIAMAKRVESVGGRPRTLVCHDMAGGYLDDRLVQGSKSCDAYRFYHWQYVDTFIYFSHHFITVPPPCWINACHKHGVPVLGTLITEWDVGRERCEQFLHTEENYLTVAEKLIQIATYYKFDGWLINIENKIEPEKVYNLVDFVRRLTERIHMVIPNSQVVWYDSVISSGELKWQNELNDLNSGFFDSCDTIFLNYCWEDEHLKRTAEHASSRGSLYDAFVGVDVFGRGCRGGGGFNTKEAVDVARKHSLSVALFAPGWVYETKGKENFTENENRFWMLLHDLCVPHSSLSLPFCTYFCQGQGHNYYCHGRVALQGPWTNLALQSQQPTHTNAQFAISPHKGSPRSDAEENTDQPMRPDQSVSVHTDLAFHGGSCLRLSGLVSREDPVLIYRLFDANSAVRARLYVSYSFRPGAGSAPADMFLDLRGQAGSKWRRLVLAGEAGVGAGRLALLREEELLLKDSRSLLIRTSSDGETEPKRFKDDRGVTELHPLPADSLSTTLRGFQLHTHADGWTTRHYLVEALDGYSLSQVQVGVFTTHEEHARTHILLGKVQIVEAKALEEVPLVTGLHITDVDLAVEQGAAPGQQRQWLTLNLRWAFPAHTADHFAIYEASGKAPRDADFHLIGHSHTTMFRVARHAVGLDARSPMFKVVPVLRSGLMPQLGQVPSVMCEQEAIKDGK